METVDTSSRLSVLRTLMKERKIDVYGAYTSGAKQLVHKANHPW